MRTTLSLTAGALLMTAGGCSSIQVLQFNPDENNGITLGADLSGLSEAARGKGLDWRAAIAAAKTRNPAPVASATPSAVAHNRPERRNKSNAAAPMHVTG